MFVISRFFCNVYLLDKTLICDFFFCIGHFLKKQCTTVPCGTQLVGNPPKICASFSFARRAVLNSGFHYTIANWGLLKRNAASW